MLTLDLYKFLNFNIDSFNDKSDTESSDDNSETEAFDNHITLKLKVSDWEAKLLVSHVTSKFPKSAFVFDSSSLKDPHSLIFNLDLNLVPDTKEKFIDKVKEGIQIINENANTHAWLLGSTLSRDEYFVDAYFSFLTELRSTYHPLLSKIADISLSFDNHADLSTLNGYFDALLENIHYFQIHFAIKKPETTKSYAMEGVLSEQALDTQTDARFQILYKLLQDTKQSMLWVHQQIQTMLDSDKLSDSTQLLRLNATEIKGVELHKDAKFVPPYGTMQMDKMERNNIRGNNERHYYPSLEHMMVICWRVESEFQKERGYIVDIKNLQESLSKSLQDINAVTDTSPLFDKNRPYEQRLLLLTAFIYTLNQRHTTQYSHSFMNMAYLLHSSAPSSLIHQCLDEIKTGAALIKEDNEDSNYQTYFKTHNEPLIKATEQFIKENYPPQNAPDSLSVMKAGLGSKEVEILKSKESDIPAIVFPSVLKSGVQKVHDEVDQSSKPLNIIPQH